MKFTSDVEAAINRAAAQTGMSPDRLKLMAWIESRGNPGAVNSLGYSGLFQMQPSEFARRGGQGSVLDPNENARVGAAWVKEKEDRFRAKYGRDPTDAEAYLLHQQGEGGAAAHMANPDELAWRNMLSTGEGRKKGEDWARRAITGNGGTDTMTSREFMDLWARKVAGFKGEVLPGEVLPGGVPVASAAPAMPSNVVAQAQPQKPAAEESLFGMAIPPSADATPATPAESEKPAGLTREQVEQLISEAQQGDGLAALKPLQPSRQAALPKMQRMKFGLGGLA